MTKNIFDPYAVEAFRHYLIDEERSKETIRKYLYDVKSFIRFLGGISPGKEEVLSYKKHLMENYAPASVNSMIAAINTFFAFQGWAHLKVKPLKIQRSLFAKPEKELSRDEYHRLLRAAKRKNNERLSLLMQTICGTGIRVSELQYITVEAVRVGRAEVTGKNKRRTIFIVRELKEILLRYARKNNIAKGCIFISRNGNPLSRHRIWADMKALCADAGVDPRKVFPHNLRHLFARTFYSIEKDLGRLADILGHTNVNTTRIYTQECGREHERILSRMRLISA